MPSNNVAFNPDVPPTAGHWTQSTCLPPNPILTSLRTSILSVLLTYLAYITVQTLYSISPFHPLSRIPGPWICKVSRIPYWIQTFQGRDAQWMRDLHVRYGSSKVRYGPWDVGFNGVEGWKGVHDVGHRIVARKDGAEGRRVAKLVKAEDYGMMPVNGAHSILMCDDEAHARVRKIFTPAFSDRALRQQEPIFKKYVHLLLENISNAIAADSSKVITGTRGETDIANDDHDKGGNTNIGLSLPSTVLEMTRYLNFTTFDIMADLCFGHPLGMLEKDEFSPWVSSIFELITLLPVSMFVEYYPVTRWLMKKLEPQWIKESKVNHFRHSADRVDKRLAEGGGEDKPDFWNLVVKYQEVTKEKGWEGDGLSVDEMHSNAELFMFAGTETTATLLSGLIYFLTTNPSRFDILKEEIRALSMEDMKLDTLAKLPYLNASIKEALRLYPPVANSQPRFIIDPAGMRIDGVWLPQGTRVNMCQLAAYHDPRNFAEPETFAPERWLGREHPLRQHKQDGIQPVGGTEEVDSVILDKFDHDQHDAWQPFGLGPRGCIGQNMAMHEARLILASLLMKFDFDLCEESAGWTDQKAHSVWVKKPLLCRVSPAIMK